MFQTNNKDEKPEIMSKKKKKIELVRTAYITAYDLKQQKEFAFDLDEITFRFNDSPWTEKEINKLIEIFADKDSVQIKMKTL